MDSSSYTNYFIDFWNMLDRNAEIDIPKEIILEQSKAKWGTKILDKKGVIKDMKGVLGYNEKQVSFGRDSGMQ